MKVEKDISRRNFIHSASAGLGLGILGESNLYAKKSVKNVINKRLPREVWVACVSTVNNNVTTAEKRIEGTLKEMENVVSFQPDIILLPETFPAVRISKKPPLSETAEVVPGTIINEFAEFAKKNNCYIICPIHTKKDGYIFNTAVLIDRNGKVSGEFHKTHPTESEMDKGVVPGPAVPPVFKTDFGTIGIQICFDANWTDDWRSLKESGAEVIFFSSAFDGGRILNYHAWMNNYYIVSCTWHKTGRIIDITGDELYYVDGLQRWFCSPINLDKELFHWDFQGRKIKEIQAKYGRMVDVKVYQLEGCVTIETRSPDINLNQIVEEFQLVTYDSYIKRATMNQDKKRP